MDNFVFQDSPFDGIFQGLIFLLDNLFKSMAQQILFPLWTLQWKPVWLFFLNFDPKKKQEGMFWGDGKVHSRHLQSHSQNSINHVSCTLWDFLVRETRFRIDLRWDLPLTYSPECAQTVCQSALSLTGWWSCPGRSWLSVPTPRYPVGHTACSAPPRT